MPKLIKFLLAFAIVANYALAEAQFREEYETGVNLVKGIARGIDYSDNPNKAEDPVEVARSVIGGKCFQDSQCLDPISHCSSSFTCSLQPWFIAALTITGGLILLCCACCCCCCRRSSPNNVYV